VSPPRTDRNFLAGLPLEQWIQLLRLDDLGRSAVRGGLAYFAVVTLIVLALEARNGRGLARFRSRSFVNDIVYTVFYRAGIYGVLWGAVFNGLEARLGGLRVEWAATWPLWVQIAAFWLVGDFIIYWLHRAQHAHPWLWAFHSVHHSPAELSTLTQNRRHLIERVYVDVALYLPLLVILGIPTEAWPVLWMVFGILEALQHGELDWDFGPLYYVVVSPVFHSIHHSTIEAHYNKNLGGMFSFWDYIFGTAVAIRSRPTEYGVTGLAMKETLASQLVVPFQMLAEHLRPTTRREAESSGESTSSQLSNDAPT
jgi:sterol desaturase/sphingolipid hydroxylase (fatty acid hydroxylase superfamily)